MLSKTNPTQTPAWSALSDHVDELRSTSLKELFQSEDRLPYLTFEHKHFYFDFSKNLLNRKTFGLLKDLSEACRLEEAKKSMWQGEPINETEDRAVLHVALRNMANRSFKVHSDDVMPLVRKELDKIKAFANRIHNHELLGYTGKTISHVVNI